MTAEIGFLVFIGGIVFVLILVCWPEDNFQSFKGGKFRDEKGKPVNAGRKEVNEQGMITISIPTSMVGNLLSNLPQRQLPDLYDRRELDHDWKA